jgi:nanoRNase/pAp phosphatase (c-di-AMP/oligoRNAs hydrolase)
MRLVTRSDFDGLICAIILKEAEIIDEWVFIHPKDLQDGKFEVSSNDVLANVPYVKGCGLWFDHHASEDYRIGWNQEVKGESRNAPSAARIIYDYYGGKDRFKGFDEMIIGVDKVDSGNLTRDEIINPSGWVLIGFISDPRTGLGRFRQFGISNYQLMSDLITYCRHKTPEEILALPDIKERVELYNDQVVLFKEMIAGHTRTEGNVIVTDLRGVDTIYSGNRFLVYSLYPEQNVSLWVVDGKQKQNAVIACGYSVLNRTCQANIGQLMLKNGGGGHKMVGTCQVPYEMADQIIKELTDELQG